MLYSVYMNSYLIPQKHAFRHQPGEPANSSPLAFAEGLFIFLDYFLEKEGFLKIM